MLPVSSAIPMDPFQACLASAIRRRPLPFQESSVSRLPTADTASGKLKEVFDNIQKSRGWASNALRSLAHAPEGLRKFQPMGHYARYETELTELQRELV